MKKFFFTSNCILFLVFFALSTIAFGEADNNQSINYQQNLKSHISASKNLNSSFDFYGQEGQALAQATCVALNPKAGWTFAVPRQCGSQYPTCKQVCENLYESQAGELTCFNSLHLYPNEFSSNTGELGLKVYKYNACPGSCGPNYCCCTNK